jgi:hypothetical protein
MAPITRSAAKRSVSLTDLDTDTLVHIFTRGSYRMMYDGMSTAMTCKALLAAIDCDTFWRELVKRQPDYGRALLRLPNTEGVNWKRMKKLMMYQKATFKEHCVKTRDVEPDDLTLIINIFTQEKEGQILLLPFKESWEPTDEDGWPIDDWFTWRVDALEPADFEDPVDGELIEWSAFDQDTGEPIDWYDWSAFEDHKVEMEGPDEDLGDGWSHYNSYQDAPVIVSSVWLWRASTQQFCKLHAPDMPSGYYNTFPACLPDKHRIDGCVPTRRRIEDICPDYHLVTHVNWEVEVGHGHEDGGYVSFTFKQREDLMYDCNGCPFRTCGVDFCVDNLAWTNMAS